jgi:hypothetical protein
MITAGVPIAVRGDDLPLAEQPPVRMLLEVLRYASGAALTEDLAQALLTGPVGGADVLYLRRLRRELGRLFPAESAQLVPVLTDVLGAEALPDPLRHPVVRVARTLLAARDAAGLPGANAESVLWAAWSASALGPRWEEASVRGGSTGAAADRDLDSVLALFAEAAHYVDRLPHVGVAEFARHVDAQQIPGDAYTAPGRTGEGVAVLTAHASKGLEWDVVAIAGVQEGSWPDLRRRGSLLGTEEVIDLSAGVPAGTYLDQAARRLAEERRLFYVACTRARRQLIVTAVAGGEEQPSRFLDELDPPAADEASRPLTALPRAAHLSGVVAELRAALCSPAEPQPLRQAAAEQLARLAEAGVPGADPGQWWGLAALSTSEPVRAPDEPVRISPS